MEIVSLLGLGSENFLVEQDKVGRFLLVWLQQVKSKKYENFFLLRLETRGEIFPKDKFQLMHQLAPSPRHSLSEIGVS